jgi:cytochrome c-type biogenesis protein CcmF
VVGLLTAVTQYFKYKDTPKDQFGKKIWLPTIIAVVISLAISLFGGVRYDKQGPGFLFAIHLAIFAAVYAVVANASYVWLGLKGKVKAAGASVAHVGFGLVLVGILISSSKKTVLSWNTTGLAVFKKDKREDPAENITLFKGVETDMGKYMVTYQRDTLNPRDRKQYFEIDFKAKDSSESFKLYPDLIKNNQGEGFSANPDARHYWHKDIFVYISYLTRNEGTDTTTYRNRSVHKGDTVFYSNGMLVLNDVKVNPAEEKGKKYAEDENALFLDMTIFSKTGKQYKASPGLAIKGTQVRDLPDTVVAESMALRFNKVLDQEKGELEIGIKESSAITDLITLKVYEFPMINVLWLGILVMVAGFVMSIVQRVRKSVKAV